MSKLLSAEEAKALSSTNSDVPTLTSLEELNLYITTHSKLGLTNCYAVFPNEIEEQLVRELKTLGYRVYPFFDEIQIHW